MKRKRKITPFASVREVSQIAGVDYQTAKFWVTEGVLPSVRTPAGWRLVPRAALEKFLAGKGGDAA